MGSEARNPRKRARVAPKKSSKTPAKKKRTTRKTATSRQAHRKPGSNKATGRDYRHEYLTYHAHGPHRVGHAMRLRARREAEIMGLVRPHDGVELHHMTVNPTDNRPEDWVFLDRCTHQLVHGQQCTPLTADAEPVAYAHPDTWISKGAHAKMLRPRKAPRKAKPEPRARAPPVPAKHRRFRERMKYVMEKCRETGQCPEGRAPPGQVEYRRKGVKAREKIVQKGGPAALMRGKRPRKVADSAAGRKYARAHGAVEA